MRLRLTFIVTVVVAGLPAAVLGQAAISLDKCQKTAAKEAAKYVDGKTKAVTNCLQRISKELIKENSATPADVAKSCASQFRKLANTEAPAKTLAAKMQAKILAACDPGVNPALAHTVADVLGPGATAPDPLFVANLGPWCTNFGGDGTIDSVTDWIACKRNASNCQADQALSTEYAQMTAWLALIRPEIVALGVDPKYADALLAIDELDQNVDQDDNGVPDLICGPLGVPPVLLLATGQTSAYCTGGCNGDDDGELGIGVVQAFTDNGDGTITDNNTDLMWEKKSDDGSIHDVDNGYVWNDAFNVFIDDLNDSSFAGHNDWRLPNLRELQSLTNAELENPAAASIWETACDGGCTVLTCSCTENNNYWTSTTYAASVALAWGIDFSDGSVNNLGKSALRRVRAVREP